MKEVKVTNNKSRSKYCKGEMITSFDELVEQEFIYCKILHNGWFKSWPIRTAESMINAKVLKYAISKGGDA